ncbi:MAG: ParA family protein [Candidatus Hodarchaeota archaeon]
MIEKIKNHNLYNYPMRYAIWNNKGGVGKSFLSFILSCEYALKNPTKKVVLIDLCPQANVSEIALGGNGEGAEKLNGLLSERNTIGGYFDKRILSPHKTLGTEIGYLITNLSKINTNLPDNLFLIAGDPSLELQAQAMNQISAQTLPLESWGNVHKWLSDLINAIGNKYPDVTFFIDCNPSFAVYTELAILSSDRLIIPCTADGSSARALDNLGRLIYGVNVPDEYGEVTFPNKAKKNGFSFPSIHVITLNRSTQFDKKASKAFIAMLNEIKRRATTLKSEGVNFSLSTNEDECFFDVPDAHTVSVVCSHEGVPLNKLKVGRHQVHEIPVQVNPEPLERYKKAIEDVVSKL